MCGGGGDGVVCACWVAAACHCCAAARRPIATATVAAHSPTSPTTSTTTTTTTSSSSSATTSLAPPPPRGDNAGDGALQIKRGPGRPSSAVSEMAGLAASPRANFNEPKGGQAKKRPRPASPAPQKQDDDGKVSTASPPLTGSKSRRGHDPDQDQDQDHNQDHNQDQGWDQGRDQDPEQLEPEEGRRDVCESGHHEGLHNSSATGKAAKRPPSLPPIGSQQAPTHTSRKRPGRTPDELYALHHLSTTSLSADAHTSATLSRESQHIFAAQNFTSMNLHPRLDALIKAPRSEGGFAFTRPTVVQSLSTQAIIDGKATFIKSQTGSGKTLAYLLPIVHRLQSLSSRPTRSEGTYAVVLAPTRELCAQIYEVLVRIVKPFIWLVPGCVSGGERRKSEKARLRKGVTLLVATPGRLLDHLKTTEAFRRDRLKFVVLDEVDRLMDMGFAKQVKEILQLLALHHPNDSAPTSQAASGQVQTVLVSATVTAAVRALLEESFGPHHFIDADEGTTGGAPRETPKEDTDVALGEVPEQLMQHVMNVTYKLKLPALCALLKNCWRDKGKVVLFVRTTATVDFLAKLFGGATWLEEDASLVSAGGDTAMGRATLFDGWPLCRLHGNVAQAERLATYKAFHAVKSGLLVCSDVAARGLDLPGVNWIIQYDPPAEISDYVHRIGRTARHGEPGSSLIFLSPSEQQLLGVLKLHGLQLDPLSLEATLQRAFLPNEKTQKPHGENLEAKAMALQLHLEKHVSGSEQLNELALRAFRSFMRGYSAHAGKLKHIFQVRALHLGHVARSFALENSPRSLPTEENSDGKRKVKKQKRNEGTDREDGFGLKRSGDEEPSDLSKAKQSSKKKDSKKKKKQKQGGWIASAADYI